MKVIGTNSEDNRKGGLYGFDGICSYDDIHSVIDWSVSWIMSFLSLIHR